MSDTNSQADMQKLQNDINMLKVENQQLSAALLLLEQMLSAFAADLEPRDRIALIRNIDDNFNELGAPDTIPTSPVPSRSSTALLVAQKLHQMSSVKSMLAEPKVGEE